MLTFEEFQKKVKYLPLEQQKECYRWYLVGGNDTIERFDKSCLAACPVIEKVYQELRQMRENYAKTEKN